MNKLFVMIAAVGIMLSGCTEVETERYDVPDSNIIGFSAFTSRAAVNNLTLLQNDAAGFKVYGTTANVDGEWYTNVNGENNYAYNLSIWGWAGDDAVWPSSDASYPMNFYAIYPVKDLSSVTAGNQLSDNITIAATAAQQVDMLSAKATADGKPSSGQISMTFQHILSKVNFGIIAGHEMTPEVMTVAIRNVHSKNTFNYIAQTWSGTTTAATGYDYYVAAGTPFTTTGGVDEETPAQIYPGTTHSNHLMLIPQSSATSAPAAWDKTSTTLPNNAYIEVVYRITDAADGSADDYVGYTRGAEYLIDNSDFEQQGLNTGWGDTYTGLGSAEGQYNGPLYVKVGFPVTLDWVKGKGYTYNVCLGTANSSNGYYVDTNYYDNEGARTAVPIIGPDGQPVDQGDPVTDGIINFLVDVSQWDESTPTVLQ